METRPRFKVSCTDPEGGTGGTDSTPVDYPRYGFRNSKSLSDARPLEKNFWVCA